MSLGGYLSQGLALGITSGEGDIIKRMDRIRSAITEPLKAVAGPPDPQRLSRAAGSAFAAAAALPLGAGEAAASGPQIVFQPSYSISVSVGDGSPASAVDIQGAVRAALAEHDEEMKAEMRRLLND